MANDLKETSPGGGISYTAPIFQFGNTQAAINSGFSFDLPLSVIQSFSNNALAYTSANSQANRSFLGGVISSTQNQVSSTAANAYAFQSRGLETLQGFSSQMGGTLNKAISAKQRGCFITTAICQQSGKPDDCDELQTLRGFRDAVMMNVPHLAALVAQYYDEAPEIVAGIEARDDSAEIWRTLETAFLRDAIAAVKMGDYSAAVSIYREMFDAARIFAKGE